jgi:acetamidase/formamidase
LANYYLEPVPAHLHGYFSRDLPPVLTIEPGDTVHFRTLDAGWHVYDHPDPFAVAASVEGADDEGHALHGPVAIAGAQPGMTLAVHLDAIRTAGRGYSAAGGYPSYWNERLAVVDEPELYVRWRLDPDAGTATDARGRTLPIRPFLGVLGMPPGMAGRHSTVPPRATGGNIDCKELIAGSTLYLPVEVPGGLFSLGDGHALQGDGEAAGPALECPMERVSVTFGLLDDMPLTMPQADTPAGWLTFGLNEDLDEAMWLAMEGMLGVLERRGYTRKEALMLASMVVDLRVTQVVNVTKGVHAVLPHGALDGCPPG